MPKKNVSRETETNEANSTPRGGHKALATGEVADLAAERMKSLRASVRAAMVDALAVRHLSGSARASNLADILAAIGAGLQWDDESFVDLARVARTVHARAVTVPLMTQADHVRELQRAVMTGSVDYPAAGQVRWEPIQGKARSMRAHPVQPANVPVPIEAPDTTFAAFLVMGNNPHVFGHAGGVPPATLRERRIAGSAAIKRIRAALKALRKQRADEGRSKPSAEDLALAAMKAYGVPAKRAHSLLQKIGW